MSIILMISSTVALPSASQSPMQGAAVGVRVGVDAGVGVSTGVVVSAGVGVIVGVAVSGGVEILVPCEHSTAVMATSPILGSSVTVNAVAKQAPLVSPPSNALHVNRC